MIRDKLSKFLNRKITEHLKDLYPHADFNLQFKREYNLIAASKCELFPQEISEIEKCCGGELILTTEDLDEELFIYTFQINYKEE